MECHCAGSGFRGVGAFLSTPEFLSGLATKDLRQEFLRDGGHERAWDQLILSNPSESFWVSRNGEGAIGRCSGLWVRWGVGTADEAVKIMASEEGFDWSSLDQKVALG